MQISVVQLSIQQLENIIEQASRKAALTALEECGVPMKEFKTRTFLIKKYGRRLVDNTIKKGQLTPHKMGKRKVYSEKEFNNLIMY